MLLVPTEARCRHQHVFIFTVLLSFPKRMLAWEHHQCPLFWWHVQACSIPSPTAFHLSILERWTPPSAEGAELCLSGNISSYTGPAGSLEKVSVHVRSKGSFIHHTWQPGKDPILPAVTEIYSHFCVLIFKNIQKTGQLQSTKRHPSAHFEMSLFSKTDFKNDFLKWRKFPLMWKLLLRSTLICIWGETECFLHTQLHVW